MDSPYFKGQEISLCGCFYPDVTRTKDDLIKGFRYLFCIKHGEIKEVLDINNLLEKSDRVIDIPSEEWREGERKRLRELNLFYGDA